MLRRLADLVATGGGEDEDWALLTAVADRLLAGRDASAASAYAEAVADDVAAGADRRALPPPVHPLAIGASAAFPRLAFEEGDGLLRAVVTFGPAFEGPPGLVHGGHLAAAFDIVLSAAAARVSPYTVTRGLQLRFLRPTPLGRPVGIEAWAHRGEHPRVEVTGRLHVDGRTTAKATAQCVQLDGDRYATRFGGSASADAQVEAEVRSGSTRSPAPPRR